jgi:hypothetical protein
MGGKEREDSITKRVFFNAFYVATRQENRKKAHMKSGFAPPLLPSSRQKKRREKRGEEECVDVRAPETGLS